MKHKEIAFGSVKKSTTVQQYVFWLWNKPEENNSNSKAQIGGISPSLFGLTCLKIRLGLNRHNFCNNSKQGIDICYRLRNEPCNRPKTRNLVADGTQIVLSFTECPLTKTLPTHTYLAQGNL